LRLFLDTSVLLAATGSAKGASRALFTYAHGQNWSLLASEYVLTEVVRNLHKVGKQAEQEWNNLQPQLVIVRDVWTSSLLVSFSPSKDRPVLLTALAFADALITLDKADFGQFLGGSFYGMPVLLPYDLLRIEREAGHLEL